MRHFGQLCEIQRLAQVHVDVLLHLVHAARIFFPRRSRPGRRAGQGDRGAINHGHPGGPAAPAG